MRKTKKRITQVAEEFVRALNGRYPRLETEIHLESFEGSDVWIEVKLPPDMRDLRPEIVDATIDLRFRFSDETGVEILTVTETMEPANA